MIPHHKLTIRKQYRRQQRQKIARSFFLRIIVFTTIFLLSFFVFLCIRRICHLLFAEPITEISSSGQISSADLTGENNFAATASSNDWALILVNSQNPVPDDYSIELTQLKNGQSVDSRCYPDLQDMMDDCRKEGLEPLICSSYRSYAKQNTLYQNDVNKYLLAGYSQTDAEEEAAKSVAPPGTSEHQLGLAVDIVDTENQRLDNSQENTKVQKWLIENSWKYGFILRYPKDKTDITGIIYEPWHYRYVGKEAAKEIYEQNLCLEEYLDYM